MSISNRTYACVVCGELRRAALPPGLVTFTPRSSFPSSISSANASEPNDLLPPVPYGHWRSLHASAGYELPNWLYHCGKPLFLLGKRAAQAATQLNSAERLLWLRMGARVIEHKGKKHWRPLLNTKKLAQAYPLV